MAHLLTTLHDTILRVRRFIRSLQRANDAVKKRWLIGCSALAMALVLGLWMAYVNLTIRPVAFSDAPGGLSVFVVPQEKNGGGGFLSTLGRGFQNLGNDISGQWQKTQEKISPLIDTLNKATAGNEYTIEPGAAPEAAQNP